MAINRISGNILQNDLVRGDNLAFQGDLIYINVADTRVGINTAFTTHTLTVDGDTNITGNLYAGAIDIDNVTANTIAVANIALGNALVGGNLVVTGLVVNTTAQIANVISTANVTLTPAAANLVIINTVSGMILPVGNTAQRPGSADSGTVRFNSETSRIEFYDGSGWQNVSTANITNQQFNGDGSSVNFALDKAATTAAVLISLNGVLQLPTTAYTVTGNTLTFTEAPESTDVIDVRFL